MTSLSRTVLEQGGHDGDAGGQVGHDGHRLGHVPRLRRQVPEADGGDADETVRGMGFPQKFKSFLNKFWSLKVNIF